MHINAAFPFPRRVPLLVTYFISSETPPQTPNFNNRQITDRNMPNGDDDAAAGLRMLADFAAERAAVMTLLHQMKAQMKNVIRTVPCSIFFTIKRALKVYLI